MSKSVTPHPPCSGGNLLATLLFALGAGLAMLAGEVPEPAAPAAPPADPPEALAQAGR